MRRKMPCAGCWSPDIIARHATLIVSEALIQHQDGVSLHPDLLLWQEQLSRYKQSWFACGAKHPLSWYGARCGVSPAAMLAARCSDLPADAQQCWVVSPYHGQLVRHNVRVIAEGMFPWSAADAVALCSVLNPLLADNGMQLFAVGAALLMTCRDVLQASPPEFGAISGQLLPDRHHEGADAGLMSRLMSEIQMALFQHPVLSEQAQKPLAVNGIWLWDACPLPLLGSSNVDDALPAVATRNPALQSMVEGNDARIVISEAERLNELFAADAPLPDQILLAGHGTAVWLTTSFLRRFAKASWRPKSMQPESELLRRLRASR